jgi:hypothetical protein
MSEKLKFLFCKGNLFSSEEQEVYKTQNAFIDQSDRERQLAFGR